MPVHPFRPFHPFRPGPPLPDHHFPKPPPPRIPVRPDRLLAERRTRQAARLSAQSTQELENDDHVTRRNLPAQCPYCGGPLRSDQVEWIDAQRAECGYCGGVV
jgi:hypothetical protein